MSRLAQRIVARCHLGPLSKDEVINYVNHRIEVAEGRSDLFSDDALNSLYEYSGGIPRLINLICDRALLGALVQEKENVDRHTGKSRQRGARSSFARNKREIESRIVDGNLFFTVLCLLYYFSNGFESAENPR